MKNSRMQSGQRPKFINFVFTTSEFRRNPKVSICFTLCLQLHLTTRRWARHLFGLTPDKEKIMADRPGYMDQTVCRRGRGRYRTDVLPEGPGQCARVHCILGIVSLLLTMLIVSTRRMILRKQNLFCLPKNKNNFGPCLDVFGDLSVVLAGFSEPVVEALIFKVFGKYPRLDQLLPGQGVLYSCESFFFLGGRGRRGSLSPWNLIVNICAFINNFLYSLTIVLVAM